MAEEEETARKKRAEEEAEFLRQKFTLLMGAELDDNAVGRETEQNSRILQDTVQAWLNEGQKRTPYPTEERIQQQKVPVSSSQLRGTLSSAKPNGNPPSTNVVPTSTSTPQAFRNSIRIPVGESSAKVTEMPPLFNQIPVQQLSSSHTAGIPTIPYPPQVSFATNPPVCSLPAWTTNTQPTLGTRALPGKPVPTTVANPPNNSGGQQHPIHPPANQSMGAGTNFPNIFTPSAAGGNNGGAQGGNYGGPQGGNYDWPQGGNYGWPQGGNYGGPQGGNYGGPQGGNYGGPQGGNYGGPQGGNYGGPQGGNYGAPQGFNGNQPNPAVPPGYIPSSYVPYGCGGPTPIQLAARQVMPHDLPKFTGDPEEWPMFSSAFYNTTEACGYSNAENLVRLQRCLDGPALMAVKSRLLLPDSVPQVMETLQKLYGRPDVLIHSLLRKLREVPAPKAENLRSIIDFGLAVQNLVDHMTIARLTEHLSNPMLLHELVEKLPALWKMQWSGFKQGCQIVNLSTFNAFMSGLVNTASDVTLPNLSATASSKSDKSSRNKSKLYVHSEASQGSKDGVSTEKEKHQEQSVRKTCSFCKNPSHEIAVCDQFKALDIDARWKEMRQKGLCRICLVPHRKWPCRSGKVCEVDGCRLRHHSLLHSGSAGNASSQAGPSRPGSVVHQNHHLGFPCTLFRYLPITVEGNGKLIQTYAFLDDGSSSTLLEAGIAAELGVDGPADPLWLNWTGNVSREEKASKRVSIIVSGRGLKGRFKLNNVRTVRKLELPSQTLQYDELKKSYPHLSGLPVQSYVDAVPGLIIGLEHVRLLSSLKVREGRDADPVAAKTRLGWCVFGRQADGNESIEQLNFHAGQDVGNRELHELMKQFFGIEEASVIIKPEAEADKRAMDILEKTTRRVDGAFECGLIWKYDQFRFPDSYQMAVKRLMALERKLSKNPELKEKVTEQIALYEEKGYAHPITEEELRSTDPSKVWYLPLGVVQNPKKPQKVRLIWDAAARVSGISFNDMLLKGPDLLVSLFAVLLRFRQKNIAICGDIKEMFHQIIIRCLDKQAQRFLFRYFPDMQPQIYVMDVATFGATCSPCQAQYVKNRNAQDFAERFPRAAEAIEKAHYVDDYLDSTDTVEEAVQLLNDVRYVHSQGGFEIRNFSSNSPEVLRRMGETDSPAYKSMNLDQIDGVERILGMVWKPASDIFSFDISIKPDVTKLLQKSIVPTKREVLRTVMSLFDPLGLLAHYIVQGKILMQDIWRSGTDWDEPIDEALREQWYRWSQLLQQLKTVEVPRCFFSGATSDALDDMQIHVFVDASDAAYSCVAYLRIVDEGTPRCALVAAKTKVAPLKPLSIPRLELQAAMIGSRLVHNVCTSLSLPIKQRFLWVDSSTVLAWLRSDGRRYHPFVAFRIGEILSLTSVDEWRKVRSSQNVADEATKWGTGPEFSRESRWQQWPTETKESTTTEELRASYVHHHVVVEPVIDVTRFSKWEKLLRTAAYVRRAVSCVRHRKLIGILSSEEWSGAENLLWRQVQMQCYPDEYAALHYNKNYPDRESMVLSKASPLYKLSPYLDENGVIRMNSRIGAAPTAPTEAKYPILLPKGQRLTFLLVDSYHRQFLHGNNETVFNEMRQQFRIPHLRSMIRHVAKECQRCRIAKAVPRPPMMASLPQERLTPFTRPFTHTGVDYFGPVVVKQGRSLVKRWIVLFTCLTVRAVHLEVAYSLTKQSCVMAIRRFIARRGAPETFYSDNGTNFVGASRILADQIRSINEDCAVTFTNARTSWRFNPPLAPHMGGPWERLVRSVKVAMAVISDHPHHPSDEVLETVILEAEAVVNSRPLTYVPLDSAEGEALTPNHFLLYGTKGVQQPPRPLSDGAGALRDSWKLSQHLVDGFWQRWVREYLPDLTRRTKWHQPAKPLQPGDVVLVVDETKRNGWVKGRVVEVSKAKDGQVRSAVVRTMHGIIKRPAVKLALLEVAVGGTSGRNQGGPELHGQGDVAKTSGHSSANKNVRSGRSPNCQFDI